MKSIFFVISLFKLLSICLGENSRLLLQETCVCPAIFDPVCCEGNIDYSSQCHANCQNASNCRGGKCDFGCAATTCPTGTKCQAKKDGSIGEVECAQIADWCETDSDCQVKNVGNCCGFYPGCVNKDYEPDLDAVREWCDKNDMVSICGFSWPDDCVCNNNKCQEMHDDDNDNNIDPIINLTPSPTNENITPRPTNEGCFLMDGEVLMGTPDTCPMILFICPDHYVPWFDLPDCGCGCKPDCNDLPDGWSLVGTPEQCAVIKFFCEDGFEMWGNECGCGCKRIFNESGCSSTTCSIGSECIENDDGTTECIELTKRRCGYWRSCDEGYECIIDPQCDQDDDNTYNRRVCAKTNGTCGGFAGVLCENEDEICAYPCGSSGGVCIEYQYE